MAAAGVVAESAPGRAVAGQPAQNLAWDVGGELASVSEDSRDASECAYITDGDRLVRKQDGKMTLHLPGGQEVTVGDEASVFDASCVGLDLSTQAGVFR